MEGGYRVLYDPRPAMTRIRNGDRTAWTELFTELHHQGDIGEVAFAAIPHLVDIHIERNATDWDTFSLAALIEERRGLGSNPDVPPTLKQAYDAAWKRLTDAALREYANAGTPELVSSILAVLAFAKGQRALGRFASPAFTEDERDEMLAPYG